MEGDRKEGFNIGIGGKKEEGTKKQSKIRNYWEREREREYTLCIIKIK